MTDLPTPVTYGRVRAWLAQAVADTDDSGKAPDMMPMTGTITFTPNVERARVPDAQPQPLILFPKPIICELDNGFLVGPDGTPEVTLVATGRFIPSYTVTFDLDGIARFAIKGILVPEGTVVDLATALEVPVEPAPEFLLWQQTAIAAQAAAVQAAASAVEAQLAVANMIVGAALEGDGLVFITADGSEISVGNIRGETGAAGADGRDGVDGKDGAPGSDGADGAPGADGRDGVDGKDGAPGADGVDGVDGAQGLVGPPGIQWRGNWAFDAEYVPNDVVDYGGAAWIAKTSNVFKPAPENPADWDLFVDRGQPGPSGEDGADGTDGLNGADSVVPGPPGPVGPAGMRWRHQWSNTVTYDRNDVVSHIGNLWIAIAAANNVGHAPSGTDTTFWQVFLPGLGTNQFVPLDTQGSVAVRHAGGSRIVGGAARVDVGLDDTNRVGLSAESVYVDGTFVKLRGQVVSLEGDVVELNHARMRAFGVSTMLYLGLTDGTDRPFPDEPGAMMFDTSLGKAIWYDGVFWVDALGNIQQ